MRKLLLLAVVVLISAPTSTFAQTSTENCVDLPRNLYRGMQGEDVRALQVFLIAEGLFGRADATGYFGLLTERSVQFYQERERIITHGTPASTGYGSVGPKTRAAMACESAPPVTPPPAPVSTKFTAGQRVAINANVQVRQTASTGSPSLGVQLAGMLGTVVSGGTSSGGYFWWYINYDSGPDGYSAEDFLSLYSAPPPPPPVVPPPPPPPVTPPPPVVDTVTTCEELEARLYAKEKAGGGTVLLPAGGDITCLRKDYTYKGWRSNHGVLIPENVTLDLNGRTLKLDLREQSYGVRLTNGAAIQNGTIHVVNSVGAGAQGIWNAAITVGAGYGDGGTPDNPSYFSNIGNWRFENIRVIQPFNHSAIQLASEAHHGVIRGVTIADSAQARIGIGADWGTVGPLVSGDEKQVEMRQLYEQGKVYSTHPHDILIENITIGRMTGFDTDPLLKFDRAGIRCSACYKVTIRNVTIAEAQSGIVLRGGDLGFEYSNEPASSFQHVGYVIEDFNIQNAHLRGLVVDGFADNIYRARLHYGLDSRTDPDTGIYYGVIRRGVIRGDRSSDSRGLWVQAATNPSFDRVDIQNFETGVRVEDWVRSMRFTNGVVINNPTPTKLYGVQEAPVDIVFSQNIGI